MNTPHGNSITRNLITGMEQSTQVSFLTEIGGYANFLVGIMNPFRTNKAHRTYPTIESAIVNSNQENRTGHSDRDYSPIRSLASGTDVTRYGQNIDNRTGTNSQGPIVTMIPEYNSFSNCNILDSARRTPDRSYRSSPWYGAAKIESEKLEGNFFFENAERKNNFEVEKFEGKIP